MILANLANTMSDRAATEKSINNLLESYREEILPQVVEGLEDLSDDEQASFSKLQNLFCGLHLLVSFAELSTTTLKKLNIISMLVVRMIRKLKIPLITLNPGPSNSSEQQANVFLKEVMRRVVATLISRHTVSRREKVFNLFDFEGTASTSFSC